MTQSLDAPRKLVLLVLAWHANDQAACWPSVSLLARECGGMTTRNLRRHLQDLRQRGLIDVQERGGTSSIYRLLVNTGSAREELAIDTGSTHEELAMINGSARDAHVLDTCVAPCEHCAGLVQAPSEHTAEFSSDEPLTYTSGEADADVRGGLTYTSGGVGRTRQEGADVHVSQTVIEPSVEPSEEPSVKGDGARSRAKTPTAAKATDKYDEFCKIVHLQQGARFSINGLARKNREAINQDERPVGLLAEGYIRLELGWWEHPWASRDRAVWQAVECFGDYESQREEIEAAMRAQARASQLSAAEKVAFALAMGE